MFSKSLAYAVQALVYMAANHRESDERWQATELAENAGLPASFLSKVLQQLTSAGLIESTRGRGGGVRPREGVLDLTLYDVALATGDIEVDSEDLPGWEESASGLRNLMRQRWQPYRYSMIEFLKGTTIGYLVRNSLS